MSELQAKDRLIFALDVPTRAQAMSLVRDLKGSVSFFKVGWELFMGGELHEVIRALTEEEGTQVFVDLKLPDDIPTTIRLATSVAVKLNVRFLTLSAQATPATIRAASEARGDAKNLKLLSIPVLSSLDEKDVVEIYREPLDVRIKARARELMEAGCDGLIASGQSIAQLRRLYPKPKALIVSPGIRPRGFGADDHKRCATPAEAIAMGADYLVVGRPIRDAQDSAARKRVAESIIDEIESASGSQAGASSRQRQKPRYSSAQCYADTQVAISAKKG